MDLNLISSKYNVRKILTTDVPDVYALCQSNPVYYKYCPPPVSKEHIMENLTALPKGKTCEDKYYIGFYLENCLVAVMDLILGYPNAETAFIGFFMVKGDFCQKGIGTSIIGEVLHYLKESGFSFVRLGYAKGNRQSEKFWLKNGFEKTGTEVPAENYVIVSMEKQL